MSDYRSALAAALVAAHQGGDDAVKSVATVVPAIVKYKDADAARDLVLARPAFDEAWLPEAYMLLATPGLSADDRQQMVTALFGEEGKNYADELAALAAPVGRLGFSFPQWRFPMMPFGNGSSLIERFGCTRLERETDRRDASLPDPQRDRFGTGYSWQDANGYTEYRRAYVLVSRQTRQGSVTLVVRNSSFLFGRDRLPAPAYVAFAPLSAADLQGVTEQSFAAGGPFIPLHNIARVTDAAQMPHRLDLINQALSEFQSFDARFNVWMRSRFIKRPDLGTESLQEGGLKHLLHFLQERLTKSDPAKPSVPYLAAISWQDIQWFPRVVVPVTQEALNDAKQLLATNYTSNNPLWLILGPDRFAQARMVLLSGKEGDFPLVTDKKALVESMRLCRLDL